MSQITIREAKKMGANNYLYFQSHLPELLLQYKGKFLAIKDETVVGAYDSFDEAFDIMSKKEKLGTFIIQHCATGEGLSTASFASNNVVFAQV